MANDENTKNTAGQSSHEQAYEVAKNLKEIGILGSNPDQTHEKRLREIITNLPDHVVANLTARVSAVAVHKGAHIGEFCAQFGVSPAEEKLLNSLLDGHTVVDHAQQNNISVNTARTQMRSLLEKTHSSGQLDLIRRVHVASQ